MKVNWLHRISVRINIGMLIVLFSLVSLASLSFWMVNQFKGQSAMVTQFLMPELDRASELNAAVKDLHREMNRISSVKNAVENRILTREVTDRLKQILKVINDLQPDSQQKSLVLLTTELMPIIELHSSEINRYLVLKKEIIRAINVLDIAYLEAIKINQDGLSHAHRELNQLYVLARSLPDQVTIFQFKQKKNRIKQIISQFVQIDAQHPTFVNTINSADKGIIFYLEQMHKIEADLSALATQTSVIVDQLNIAVQYKFLETKRLLDQRAGILREDASQFSSILIGCVLLASLFTCIVMILIHRKVSKRLIHIANSIGAKENQEALLKEAKGRTEISQIAQSIMKYILRNERQTAEIKENNKQLQLIIQNSNQAVIIYQNDQIVFTNEYCSQMLDISSFISPEVVSHNLLMALSTLQYKDRLKVGPYYFRFFATDIDWNGKASTLALLTDITNEVKKEAKLLKSLEVVKDESHTDTLTGLYNRRKLDAVLESNAIDSYALIVADIDWFKAFNDFYGHAEGDVCLTKVALAIKESLRSDDDIAVRYGGEEFLILLVGSSLDQAVKVAKRIQLIIEKFDIKHEKSAFNQLSLSLGVAHSSEGNGEEWQTIFKLADQRLYQAKEQGRSTIVCGS
ncbi:MAG: diguanylate cyclase [Pseudomonadales bacterium]